MGKVETKYKFQKYNRDVFYYTDGVNSLIFTPSYQSIVVPEMTITEIKAQGCMMMFLNGKEI